MESLALVYANRRMATNWPCTWTVALIKAQHPRRHTELNGLDSLVQPSMVKVALEFQPAGKFVMGLGGLHSFLRETTDGWPRLHLRVGQT